MQQTDWVERSVTNKDATIVWNNITRIHDCAFSRKELIWDIFKNKHGLFVEIVRLLKLTKVKTGGNSISFYS